MIGNDNVQPPVICSTCGADAMSCGIKRGLSGRRCCDHCGHDDDDRTVDQ